MSDSEQDDGAKTEPETPSTSKLERFGQIVGAILLVPFLGIVLALPVGVVWAIVEAFPSGVEERPDAGFFDRLLSSVAVLWAIRIVVVAAAVMLVFAGVYFTVSIVVRTVKGQWLRRAGPFEPDLEKAEEALDEGVEMFDDLEAAWEREEDLENRLEESNQELVAVTDQLEANLAAFEQAWTARDKEFDRERQALREDIDPLRRGKQT